MDLDKRAQNLVYVLDSIKYKLEKERSKLKDLISDIDKIDITNLCLYWRDIQEISNNASNLNFKYWSILEFFREQEQLMTEPYSKTVELLDKARKQLYDL